MSKKMTFQEFIKKYIEIHGELKYEFDETTFVNSHTPMKAICKKHGEFWKTPKNLLKYDCWDCSYELRAKNNTLTTIAFIEKAKKVHGEKYIYSESIYSGAKIPLIIKCPDHGEFKQTPNDHLNGKGCPVCKESHLERDVKLLLNKHNVTYEWQFKSEWLGRQSLDFYLPEYNLAIECQGKQHFGVGGWGNDYDFNYVINSDIKKYNILKNRGINILYFINHRDKSLIFNNEMYANKVVTKENLIDYIKQNDKAIT